MIVGQNNYSIISMLEKRVMEYYEEPLALKSFVDDEIYNAIITSAQMTLAGLPSNCLYIVSETDLVSAEVLSIKMNVETSVKFLECNKFAQNEIIPVNLNVLPNKALQVTLEAIGAGVSSFSEYPLKMNLIKEKGKDIDSGVFEEEIEIPSVNIGGLEIELTSAFVKRLAAVVAGLTIIPLLIIWLLLGNFINPQEQAKVSGLDSQITTANAEIAKYNKPVEVAAFDLTTAISNIIEQNTTKLDYYSALGLSVPSKLWVTYYNLNGAGKIDIKGQASDVKSIYVFYKNLKDLVNNSDVKLYKLEINSGSIDDIISDESSGPKIYDFEITNMTEAELNPPKEGDTATATTATATEQTQQGTAGQQSGIKSMFGGQPSSPETNPPAATPAPASGGLPKNLEKIEKF